MIISPQMTTSIYSGVGGGQILPPNAVSGLLMWHDASVGGLTSAYDLAPLPQDMSGAEWYDTRLDRTGGDGTVGYTFREDSDIGVHQVYPDTLTVGVNFYFGASIKVKRGVGTRDLQLYTVGLAITFKLDGSNAYTVDAGTDGGSSIVGPDADGFYTCTVHGISNATDTLLRWRFHDGSSTNYAGDGASTLIMREPTASGGRYSAMADQAGVAHFAQATASVQPDGYFMNGARSAINGVDCPFLRYDPAVAYNKFLTTPSTTKAITNKLHDGTGVTYLIALMPQNSPAVTTVIMSSSSSSNSHIGCLMYWSSSAQTIVTVVNGTEAVLARTTGVVPLNEPQVYTYRMSSTYGSSLRRNGVELLAPAALDAVPSTDAHSELYKWGRAANVASPNAAYMGDALYDSVLSDAIVAKLERYWASRMGISF